MQRQESNFPTLTESPDIRIRAVARDSFEGLRGHAYIIARQLNTRIERVQTSANPVDAGPAKDSARS